MNADLVRSARGGDRTRKRLPSRDFKSLASTGFATRAATSSYARSIDPSSTLAATRIYSVDSRET